MLSFDRINGLSIHALWDKSMSVLTGTDHIDILISETEIKARINHLAKEITHQFKDTEKLVVVGLLRG